MKLLKVGDRYVNLDLVTNIRAGESSVSFYFAAQEGENRLLVPFNDPEQAAAINRWLQANSDDALNPTAPIANKARRID